VSSKVNRGWHRLLTLLSTFGRKPFGTTPAAFDHLGIAEYLDGTGLKGGPLVVGLNDTENSDKRIFKSDNNVTMNGKLYLLGFLHFRFGTILLILLLHIPVSGESQR
jgi:hypothetical protein